METSAMVAKLGALAQDTRLRIFRLLVAAGTPGLTPGKIGTRLEVPPATLSFHLKELTHAGLITSSQEGRFIHYTANYQTMIDVIAFLTDNCCAGSPCDASAMEVCGTVPRSRRRKASA